MFEWLCLRTRFKTFINKYDAALINLPITYEIIRHMYEIFRSRDNFGTLELRIHLIYAARLISQPQMAEVVCVLLAEQVQLNTVVFTHF